MGEVTKHDVGEPGFLESLAPVWGSGRQSLHDFQQGNPIRGTLWAAMAVSDALMVGFLAKAGIKIIGKIGLEILIEEGGKEAGSGLVSGTYRMARVVGRTSSAVVRDLATGARQMAVTAWQPDKWRSFGNMRAFLSKSRRNWLKLIWNDVKSGSARDAYSRLGRLGRKTIEQQHWIFMNSTKWIPQGLRNARLNFLEIPYELNHWMGDHVIKNVTFRMAVATTLKADFLATYKATEALVDRLWQHCLSNPPQPPPTGKK